MDAVKLIRRLHQHRHWVNLKLLDACGSLSDDRLHQPFPIGQGSIWRSLMHLYGAEYIWLEALLGNDDPVVPGDVPGKLPGNQQGAGGITRLDDLKRRWAELAGRWEAYLANLPHAALDEPVFKYSTSSGRGKRYGTSRADVLLHVCTHAQYTTAQTVNMLRQSGVDPLPDVMLITMARQETAEPRRTASTPSLREGRALRPGEGPG